MKKINLFILSISTILLLVGCQQGSSQSNYKIDISCAKDTSQLSSNCKEYIDAMHDQQGEIYDDFVLNDLKGNEGVDAVNYYDDTSLSLPEKSDRSKGVKLTITPKDGYSSTSYTIEYGLDKDLADKKEFEAVEGENTLKNLFQNTKYYWRAVGEDGTSSAIKSFKTGDYTRWIDADQLFNVRDMGGYLTESGKRVKQGLIFRGGEITTAEWGTDHALTYTEKGKKVFREEMGIKVEVDFRTQSQRQNGQYTKCEFAEDGDIEFKNIELGSFSNALNYNGNLIKELFEVFAQADQKPVYYHCHGGADRTGTAGFLLLSVLGVSYTDVVIDYELTSFSSIKGGDCHRSHLRAGNYNDWPGMITTLKSLKVGNETIWNDEDLLCDNIERFLIKKCGVSQETINTLRSIMLED